VKVKCIGNNSEALSKRIKLLHWNPRSKWPIDLGESYDVYGILLWAGNLHYLIVNRYKGVEQHPVYCPAELFEITDPKLPKEWYFPFRGIERENDAIWGYKELVLVTKHSDDIQERDEEALNIFIKRKKEIDEYFSQTQ
jgi:hypothetical protein